KPYVAYTDAIVDARSGWLGDDAPADPGPKFVVHWHETAAAQAEWIESRTALPLRERATTVLELGPEPHPYRRIRRVADGFTLAVKDWRISFRVDDRRVDVLAVDSACRPSELARADPTDAALVLHQEFRRRW